MCVVSLGDRDTCPSYLRDLVKDGARFMKLSSILEATHGVMEVNPQPNRQGDKSEDELTAHEIELILTLQRRWRRILPRILEMRELRGTTEGAMLSNLHQLCLAKLGTDPLSALPQKVKIAIRAFVFTDAFIILIGLAKVTSHIQQLRKFFNPRFENTTTIEELEELVAIPAQFMHSEVKLRTISDTFSIKVLYESNELMSLGELKMKARNAQRILKAVELEIQLIENKLSN